MVTTSQDPTATALTLVARFLLEAGALHLLTDQQPRWQRSRRAQHTGYTETLSALRQEASKLQPDVNIADMALTNRAQPELRAVVEDWLAQRLERVTLEQANPLQDELDALELKVALPEKVRLPDFAQSGAADHSLCPPTRSHALFVIRPTCLA